ncbi:MMPL family transporter [Amycolatopsis saalfeldensis]|uniref:Putative drug exporter of the RND superfamily n=1 Tax=Amycolatopsis saalfeldensis TaxID=394193 RepID=A0A1H8QM51_9PSEU|nr:MMPL family transporter [Amycolatopsis saalfeldensis]SEO55309.1 putative drug exporter of the RND superfamily [Amycolatopsis saalfeldensis]
MAALLYRLGAGVHRHRLAVLMAWLAVLVAVGALAATAGGSYEDDFSIPGSRAQQTLDTVAGQFPDSLGATVQVVLVAPAGHKVAEYEAVVEQTLAAAAKAPQVAEVVDPFTAKMVSPDGGTALADVSYHLKPAQLASSVREKLENAFRPARDAGLRVEFGGSAYGGSSEESGGGAEVVGLLIALLVLVLTFGSLAAAGLPLLTTLAGVGATVVGLGVIAGLLTLPTTAPAMALMLGLAVGIDYALFIVARHRSQLASGMPVAESVARATGTAGTAVVFAGLTVVIALAGLSVVGIPFLTAMGLAAATAVIVSVLVAVTLLPAVLGFAGERLRPKPGSRAVRREAGAGRPAMGARWVRLVTRRPLVTVLAVVAALGVMAVPAAGLRLALTDNGSAPAGSTQRQAYDLTAAAFGPGFNGPLLVLADLRKDADGQAAATALAERLGSVAGAAVVARPQLSASGRYALVEVIPETGPQDERTEQVVAGIEAAGGASVGVTGATAIGIDISALLSASLVPFALIVVGLAFLLLMVAFRSLVVPLKATLGFLLSVGASLGAVVAVFQWGWLAGLIGVPHTGPVISFMPIILMAVLFGLAMDYEVFLISRMHEEHVRGGDPRRAVTQGFRASARVVAAAALIMIAVFASFIPGGDATLKPIAFALVVGVLLDAFLVRMTLVPAVLTLARRGAWWLPRWLDRVLPNLDVEGARLISREDERAPVPAKVV